jgi:hypothetical protein
MGIEVLSGITQWVTSLGVSGISSWLAIAGFIIIVIVAAGYGVYGLIKLGKWLANMRIKEFSLVLLGVGILFLGLAAVLP